jgi:trans-aconitate 2-methyltransferase
MPWDPAQYLAFASERLRPALDLLARVPARSPERILDLGSGAGNVTQLLADRWPRASVLGVDSSPEMLARAASALPSASFLEADIATWEPRDPADLVFSNAVLHWLGDHRSLFPRLASWVRPGGHLAIQMPASFDHASHTAAREAAAEGPWSQLLDPDAGHAAVARPEDYVEWLSTCVRRLDLWETTYFHLLEGPDPVAEWFKGSLLVPYLAALPEQHRAPFFDAYRRRVRDAYPPRADGRTVMPMRRIFMVAEV